MRPLRVKEAAKLLGVHQNTIYRALRDGILAGRQLRPNGTWMIDRKELERWRS